MPRSQIFVIAHTIKDRTDFLLHTKYRMALSLAQLHGSERDAIERVLHLVYLNYECEIYSY